MCEDWHGPGGLKSTMQGGTVGEGVQSRKRDHMLPARAHEKQRVSPWPPRLMFTSAAHLRVWPYAQASRLHFA